MENANGSSTVACVTPGRRLSRRSSRGTPFRSKTPNSNPPGIDRFIPSRANVDKDLQLHVLTQQGSEENSIPSSAANVNLQEDRFKEHLAEQLFEPTAGGGSSLLTGTGTTNGATPKGCRILSFKQKAPKPPSDYQNALQVLYSQNRCNLSMASRIRSSRFVSSTAEKVLDAPDLLDDYYVNLLDWSSKDILAVGLGQSLYLWDASSGKIDLLTDTNDAAITSVSWISAGTHLAIGTTLKEIQLWDVEAKRKVRSMHGHQGRVCSLAWNKHVLSSGSFDTDIFNHDVRIAEHHISSFKGHNQEVCGLSWSPDGTQLASGGNDNLCNIWQLSDPTSPRYTFTDHTAAVKALAWSPHARAHLATGGGTSDRHIRFWNTSTGACLNAVDTQSQVCSLVWNPHEPELLSAHGFTQNQLTLWKYPSMGRVSDLTGHISRVLHMALSPDGTTVCSAAADETLRFWKVFEPVAKSNKIGHGSKSSSSTKSRKLNGMSIR